MNELLLNRITNVHNDVNLGVRRSFSAHNKLTYFVEVHEPKSKDIERFFVTKREYEKVVGIWEETLKAKAKLKAKEKRLRQKLALQKKQEKLDEVKKPVELDEIDEIEGAL